ncbi:MAG: hypothetical protein M0R17_08480 [Candidatus Omnitrophica bacterium]|jgi:hypothetical protein|nr:hypothetical protein [Candidatus Omnitrophota bacterium]
MKLYKALKLKKKLTGEIAFLEQQISSKNSFQVDQVELPMKFNVEKLNEELMTKVYELIQLKLKINVANNTIQEKIFWLSEYKSLISFWKNNVSGTSGMVQSGYSNPCLIKYDVQFDETKRNELIDFYQNKLDEIQEEIDTFNYNTEI